VRKEFDAAEALYKKALDIKTDFFDALAQMAGVCVWGWGEGGAVCVCGGGGGGGGGGW